MVLAFYARLTSAIVIASLSLGGSAVSASPRALGVGGTPENALLPTGNFITATAAPGSRFYRLVTGLRPDGNADATDATATSLSPDGKTLLVLTSGYNLNFRTLDGAPLTHNIADPTSGASSAVNTSKSEWVFVFDVSGGLPRKLQQISIPDTYDGVVWRPDSRGFYVSGGIDDRVYNYTAATRSEASLQFTLNAPAIFLGHDPTDTAAQPSYKGSLLRNTVAGKASGQALTLAGVVANLAISADGSRLYAANLENDSLSVADTASRKILREVQFFHPGQSQARGEFPYGVAVRSQNNGISEKAYVTSLRDDQVLVVANGAIKKIVPVGSGPNNVLLSKDERNLYVVNGNGDSVSIIDTNNDTVQLTISLARPGDRFKGSNPNGLALSPNGRYLYVTLGGENAVAVVDLKSHGVVGRIPTGWYPTSISVGKDGKYLYIVNEKSVPGPNPGLSNDDGQNTPAGVRMNRTHKSEYVWALEKAGLLVVPTPDAATLGYLSRTVDNNDGFYNRSASRTMAYLHNHIHHVIYIVKENRSYDQVFGDVSGGNGVAALTLFPQPITPNHHKLATDFVLLDNFYDPGESSGVGWDWTTEGHTTDYVERNQAVDYGNGGAGLSYDYEGTVRNVNLALAQTGAPSPFSVRETGIFDPSGSSSIMPGPRDVSAPEGAGVLGPQAVGGYIWDEALRRGKSLRNYGFFIDLDYYFTPGAPGYIPISATPYASHITQAPEDKPELLDRTDVYFRGFDQAAPDIFRYNEWAREFDAYVAKRDLPSLELVRIEHDHFGAFSSAVGGLNTPQLQIADNDYALGKIVEKVSHSPYANDTAIFVIEDDAQNGPDHVDAHRSLGLVVSPYTRRGAIVHTTYTTDNVLRTIEGILDLAPLGQQDANAAPMDDVFTTQAVPLAYQTIVPGSLCTVPIRTYVPECQSPRPLRTRPLADLHDGAWWSAMTAQMDFSHPDKLDPLSFDAVLWYGMTGTIAPADAVL